MNKTLTILLLAISTLAQAQTTLLCEDDFNASTAECNIFNSKQVLQKTNGELEFNSFSSTSFDQNVSISYLSNLSGYDTLILEMDLRIYNPYSYSFNQFMITREIGAIQFTYTDATNSKTYTGNIKEDNPNFPFEITLPNYINTYSGIRLVSKITKPTDTTIFLKLNPRDHFPGDHLFSNASWGKLKQALIGRYNYDFKQDQGFSYRIIQDFCATTDNPIDCQAKVQVFQPVRPIRFTIDNFKAYGIKEVVTVIEEDTITRPRTVIGMYNTMGQKLETNQEYDGLVMVIKVYSDGSKEKVFSMK